jgi:uncharacterized protein (TIGR02996 family)
MDQGALMSVEEAFLPDICANPDDITPRLMYADWLDDRGGKGDAARAEFIRLQCRPDGDPARQKELLEQWGKAWTKPLRGLFARHEFRRGFIERVTMKAKTFVEEGERILGMTPLRYVKLRDPKEYVEKLAGCKSLARLDGLNLNYGQIGLTRAVYLLRSKYLGAIRWLDLGDNKIGLGGIRALLDAADRLPSLRFLTLDDNRLRDEGVTELVGSPFFGQLRALNLDGNDLTDSALDQLAAQPAARGLVQLHLCRNDLTGAGLARLIQSSNLAGLRKVYLYGTAPWEQIKQLKE